MGHPSSAVPKRRSRGTSGGCRGSRRAVLVPGIIVFPGLPRFKLDVDGDPRSPALRAALRGGSLRARLSFPRRPPFAGIVSNDMKADPRTEAEVMHVLSRIVETASSRDVDGAMALFADDPNVFLLGTGVDEARTGHAAIREQIERDLTQSDALSWTLSPQNISAAGSVAWTSGDVVVRVSMGGQTLDIPHRPRWDRHAPFHRYRGIDADGRAPRGPTLAR